VRDAVVDVPVDIVPLELVYRAITEPEGIEILGARYRASPWYPRVVLIRRRRGPLLLGRGASIPHANFFSVCRSTASFARQSRGFDAYISLLTSKQAAVDDVV